ncbi:hypothetical protein DFH09DRAFT_1090797 [Mycena vulgaris]|nr:hypothetical protein DFH09DRAFT_1090797 [Mycena vulgaris]
MATIQRSLHLEAETGSREHRSCLVLRRSLSHKLTGRELQAPGLSPVNRSRFTLIANHRAPPKKKWTTEHRAPLSFLCASPHRNPRAGLATNEAECEAPPAHGHARGRIERITHTVGSQIEEMKGKKEGGKERKQDGKGKERKGHAEGRAALPECGWTAGLMRWATSRGRRGCGCGGPAQLRPEADGAVVHGGRARCRISNSKRARSQIKRATRRSGRIVRLGYAARPEQRSDADGRRGPRCGGAETCGHDRGARTDETARVGSRWGTSVDGAMCAGKLHAACGSGAASAHGRQIGSADVDVLTAAVGCAPSVPGALVILTCGEGSTRRGSRKGYAFGCTYAGIRSILARLPPLVLALMRVVLVVLRNPNHQRASQTDRIRIRTKVYYHPTAPSAQHNAARKERPSTGLALAFLPLKKRALRPRIAGVGAGSLGSADYKETRAAKGKEARARDVGAHDELGRCDLGRNEAAEGAPDERAVHEVYARNMRVSGGRFRGDPR